MKKKDQKYVEWLNQLRNLQNSSDTESAHQAADSIIEDIALDCTLNIKQRKILVDAYMKIEKWYA